MPFCQRYQPAHVDNTVLQMPRFHQAAAMLLLLMLPDAQTKKIIQDCNAKELTHI
jgi:hypothetical protein